MIDFLIESVAVVGFGYIAIGAVLSAVVGLKQPRVRVVRLDCEGRDVTELPGLWDEADRLVVCADVVELDILTGLKAR